MTETKMLVYAGLGLLLLLRAIINNNIFNTINKNYLKYRATTYAPAPAFSKWHSLPPPT